MSTLFAERPNGKRLFDILREGDTLLVRWVDRLGRNYGDVRDTIQEFMRRGVVVRTVINGLTFDGATKEPMQQAVRDALIGFLAGWLQKPKNRLAPAPRAASSPIAGDITLVATRLNTQSDRLLVTSIFSEDPQPMTLSPWVSDSIRRYGTMFLAFSERAI
jgi:Resolvase, N terminal domain